MARATSSLPVPRSPVTSTLAALLAARPICSTSFLMAGLSPTSSPVAPAARRRSRASASARVRRKAVSTAMSRASVLSGFSRKFRAPTRTARTAVSMVACPLIMMTGVSALALRMRCEQLHPVAVGEHHVEEAEIVGALLQLFLGDLDAARHVDAVALQGEGLLQRGEDRRLVVDDEQVRAGHRRSVVDRDIHAGEESPRFHRYLSRHDSAPRRRPSMKRAGTRWLAALLGLAAAMAAVRDAQAHGDVDVDRPESPGAQTTVAASAQPRADAPETEHEERAWVTLDMVLGWGKVPFAVQNLPDTGDPALTYSRSDRTQTDVQSFVRRRRSSSPIAGASACVCLSPSPTSRRTDRPRGRPARSATSSWTARSPPRSAPRPAHRGLARRHAADRPGAGGPPGLAGSELCLDAGERLRPLVAQPRRRVRARLRGQRALRSPAPRPHPQGRPFLPLPRVAHRARAEGREPHRHLDLPRCVLRRRRRGRVARRLRGA